jgi:hypothetical protein
MDAIFAIALGVALIGLVVAGRFLWTAWSDYRFRRDKRRDQDRRQTDLPVPMERRQRSRRQPSA